ncbi:MAG: ribosome maturation factor RimM [Spirochaetaceae bacterium]|jgi:16S rRNA processing protein RimM|nr:ribosome maturation factor RimM [Spirochaetaceae bacterium]
MLSEFVTAYIAQPFGVEGFVKVRSLSGETEHLLARTELRLRFTAGQGDGTKTYTVEQIRRFGGADDVLLIKFAGVDTPEAAKKLQSAEIITPREESAPLADDEFYIEDLKGLAVRGLDGSDYGHIENIVEGGGGQLVELLLPEGASRLVPFRHEFFGEVSVEHGFAVLIRPEIIGF